MSMGFSDDDLSHLHSDAENYDVYCERCKRVHRFYTYTREDHQRIISAAAKNLADEIDSRAVEEVIKNLAL